MWIATYSQHLVESAPHGADVVFAPQVSAGDLVCADEEFVLRNWIVGKESNYLENLQPHIDALRLDVIVIQFNYGFFNHRELSAFIRRQHDASTFSCYDDALNCGSAGKRAELEFPSC